MTEGGGASSAGRQRGGEPREVKVVGAGAHGNVVVLRTLPQGRAKGRGRGAGVHGYIVILRLAAVRVCQGAPLSLYQK